MEKSSSRRLVRSKSSVAQKSNASIQKSKSVVLFNDYLEKILDKDNDLLNVCCIRDEIIDKAIEIGYQKYLDKVRVSFLVHCLREGYLNALKLEYINHDKKILCFNKELWSDEKAPVPSPQDSCAQHSVPIKTIDHAEDVAEEPLQEIEIQTTVSSASIELELNEILGEHEEYAAEESCKKYDTDTDELFGEISEESFFTVLAQAQQNFLATLHSTRCETELPKPEPYSVPAVAPTKLRVQDFISKLPPLKLKIKYKPELYRRSITKMS